MNQKELDKQIKETIPQRNSEALRKRFIKGCEDDISNPNYLMRKNAVSSQFCRNEWEIEDKFGKIRISKIRRSDEAIRLGFQEYVHRITGYFFVLGVMSEVISPTEYEDLKKIYFGDFPINHEYLQSLGRTVRNKE